MAEARLCSRVPAVSPLNVARGRDAPRASPCAAQRWDRTRRYGAPQRRGQAAGAAWEHALAARFRHRSQKKSWHKASPALGGAAKGNNRGPFNKGLCLAWRRSGSATCF